VNLFSELDFKIGPMSLSGDNQGSIFLASNPVQEHRTKHIDIRHHFIRQCVEENKVKLYFIPTKDQLADIQTKNLTFDLFKSIRDNLGLETIKRLK